MSVTGIVAALAAEARTLGPALSAAGRFRAPGGMAIQTLSDGNLLIVSGMGPQAAAAAARALAAAGARGLLSFGLAGALDPILGAGTVLLPEAVTDGSGRTHATGGPWRDRLAAASGDLVVRGGTLLSAPRPLTTAAHKSQARSSTGACAVDTESFAIAGVAAGQGMEFAAARVVVDMAFDSLPRCALQATDERGEVSVPRLVMGLLRNPLELPALLRLAQRYRMAMRSLRCLGRHGVGQS